jgi:subfamily B ATP-binding cassette protein HlyB/CyaB
LLAYQGVAVSEDQLCHQFGLSAENLMSAEQMVLQARAMGMKARIVTPKLERLGKSPLPAIVGQSDGSFLIIGQTKDGNVLVQRPLDGRPVILPIAEFAASWDGRLILIARRAAAGDLNRKFDLAWFLPAIHRYRHVLGEVLLASLFIQILGLVSPLFFQVVIDKVLVHRGLTTLDVLIFGLVAISVFEGLLGGLRTYVFAHTTNRIDVELGAKLFRHLLALPLVYFQSRRVGDSVARVRELENIRSFLTGSALTLVIDLLFTTVFLAVMWFYSSTLTLIVLATLPFYVGISVVVTPIFKRRLDEKFKRGAENQAFLVEAVTGIETLKAMAVEPQMHRRWEEQLASYVQASFSTQNLGNVATQAITWINKASIAAVLYFGARSVIDGDLTVGELVAFNMLSGRVAQPVLRIAQLWQDFQQARISVDRLGDILNTRVEGVSSAGRASLPAIKGEITFEHVRFRYRPDAPLALDDVNFSVKTGQVVGVVGPSGSGKSTLTKLVQRLYVPEQGRVMVDGVDLAMVDTAWLRRQIGVVLQENVLFNRPVRENIALADPAMPMERVIEAAKLAGAHEFILELPHGYDTEIGERGASLSGGQRQRIAIARALVTNPRILIFDEATSALDYESERIIQQNMRRIVAGRTVLIIAHRLSTVRTADRILTIERGRLVEDGTHDELIRNGGRYAMLHQVQAGMRDEAV